MKVFIKYVGMDVHKDTIAVPGAYPHVKSRSSMIGHINLDMKHAGERSAGNPPAAFDAQEAGNVMHPNDR